MFDSIGITGFIIELMNLPDENSILTELKASGASQRED